MSFHLLGEDINLFFSDGNNSLINMASLSLIYEIGFSSEVCCACVGMSGVLYPESGLNE